MIKYQVGNRNNDLGGGFYLSIDIKHFKVSYTKEGKTIAMQDKIPFIKRTVRESVGLFVDLSILGIHDVYQNVVEDSFDIDNEQFELLIDGMKKQLLNNKKG